MVLSLLALALGFGMNLLLGKPSSADLIIGVISKMVTGLEKILNDAHPGAKKKVHNPKNEYLWGIVLVVLVTIFISGGVKLFLFLVDMIHPLAALFFETLICWQLLSLRPVHDAGVEIYEQMRKEGMDAQDEAIVTKTAVRAILADMLTGTIAPMFYMMLGGAALGVFYTAIYVTAKNIAQDNERFVYFGAFAGKLYRVVRFIPAKLDAVYLLMAVSLLKLDKKNAWKIYRRDKSKKRSQNDSYAESVVSGVLHIQLADTMWDSQELYGNQLFEEDGRPLKPTDILRVNRLMYSAAFVALTVFVVVKLLIILIF